MKRLLTVILTIFSFGTIFASSNLGSGNIVPGAGYSSDSQQVAPEMCYNAAISSTSAPQTILELETAMSFNELQDQLKTDVDVSGHIGMFSASAEASYLRSVQAKDYSLSLNYFEYSDDNVGIQIDAANPLNADGVKLYKNGDNPYFGLICGDNYFSSYKQGAMLVMGLRVEFGSLYEKQQFEAKAGTSYSDIISASAHIQAIAKQYHIKGVVAIQAYQIGGDPSQLAKILSKDSKGNYYTLSCSIQNMENCVQAANGLLDYAKNDFSNQFSFTKNTGLVPLGVGFSEYTPIQYIGLTPPPSLVTPQVILDRLTLAKAYKRNRYYEQKFRELLVGYPGTWDQTSSFYKTAKNLLTHATNNVTVITSPSDPNTGGLGCFNEPGNCGTITKTILAQLTPIESSDLDFLSSIQYTYPRCNWDGVIYPHGDGTYVPGGPAAGVITKIARISLTPTNYSLVVAEDDPAPYGRQVCSYTATSTDGGKTYTGDCDCTARNWGTQTGHRENNPFYFTAYSG